MKRLLVSLAAALVAVSTVAAQPVHPAAASTTGTLVSLTADPGPHVAVGMTVTASVTLTAVIDEPRGPVESAWAEMQNRSGAPVNWAFVALHQQSAVGTRSTWSGSVAMGSTAAGSWLVYDLVWNVGTDVPGGSFQVVVNPFRLPATDARVVVDGSAAPTVSWQRIPAWVPYGARQWVRYTYRYASGKPLAHWPVAYGVGSECQWVGHGPTDPQWPRAHLTTDAYGRITVRAHAMGSTCLKLATAATAQPGGQADLGAEYPSTYMAYKHVTIHLTSTHVRAGHRFSVTGRVLPTLAAVSLQMRVGRHWRVIGVGDVSLSGIYRVTVAVAKTGRYRIRALAFGVAYMRATASPSIVITVTR